MKPVRAFSGAADALGACSRICRAISIPAHKLGMRTVLIAGEQPWRNDGPVPPDDYADYVHHETDDLCAFLRELNVEATT